MALETVAIYYNILCVRNMLIRVILSLFLDFLSLIIDACCRFRHVI